MTFFAYQKKTKKKPTDVLREFMLKIRERAVPAAAEKNEVPELFALI
jgi:hypothetical protein